MGEETETSNDATATSESGALDMSTNGKLVICTGDDASAAPTAAGQASPRGGQPQPRNHTLKRKANEQDDATHARRKKCDKQPVAFEPGNYSLLRDEDDDDDDDDELDMAHIKCDTNGNYDPERLKAFNVIRRKRLASAAQHINAEIFLSSGRPAVPPVPVSVCLV